jgi:hypothetical protein
MGYQVVREEDNRKMVCRYIERGRVDWMELAQDRVLWWADLRFIKTWKFLTS